KLQSVLGDSVTSCEIESATEDMSSCLQASALLSPLVLEQMFSEVDVIEEQSSRSRSDSRLSVTMDNSLSPAHTLIQIQCGDHKGLLYDIMRTVKDCNIQDFVWSVLRGPEGPVRGGPFRGAVGREKDT
uniref:ACT domain-containing protein ACR n=1 Tax=Aegilops tauschii subsp. strangulata TaxID=200361 RepID=A0A453GXZ8_AEGTS